METTKKNGFKRAPLRYLEGVKELLRRSRNLYLRLEKLPPSGIAAYFAVQSFFLSLVVCMILVGIDYTGLLEINRIANGSIYAFIASLYAVSIVMAFRPLHIVDTVPKLMFKSFVPDYNIPEISTVVRRVGFVFLISFILSSIIPLLLWGFQIELPYFQL